MKLSDVRELYNVDEYREALKIDQHRLDDMLMQQPVIQQTISEMAAEVTSMRDAAKERLIRVDAQVARVLRNRITVEEGKASETRVDREIPLTREHKDAHHIYNELCALAAQWDALKDTARNRSFVIRDLVSLYTSNFFTDTSFRSPSNPQAVQQLAYQSARAALAEGRRVRKSLSGVSEDPELRAKIDEEDGEDADLDGGAAPVSRARAKAAGTADRPARSTTRRNAKKTASQGIDTDESDRDTTPQDTDNAEENDEAPAKRLRPSSTRDALRARVRQRSGKRVMDHVADDDNAGADPLETPDTDPVESAPEDGTGDTAPRRRRRYARERPAS